MDISATVRLDSQESTVKLVSTPFKFQCSINMTNHIFTLHAKGRAKGLPVTEHWTWKADQHRWTSLGFCSLCQHFFSHFTEAKALSIRYSRKRAPQLPVPRQLWDGAPTVAEAVSSV